MPPHDEQRDASRRFSGPGGSGTSSEGSCRARLPCEGGLDQPTTRDLTGRLVVDSKLLRPGGGSSVRAVPSEATSSRAFAEFALRDILERSFDVTAHPILASRLFADCPASPDRQDTHAALPCAASGRPERRVTEAQTSGLPAIYLTCWHVHNGVCNRRVRVLAGHSK